MVRADTIAVALHDVEPATFGRCAVIRDWLADVGVERVTLLVIPAADLHPFFQRSPALVDWLHECRDRGDAIAQHGLHHRSVRNALPLRQAVAAWQGGRAAEFPGLDREETRAHVETGHRLLTLAGLEPRGFVAPGYAHTLALRRELAQRFDWWATLLRVHGAPGGMSPALGLGTSSRIKLALSPKLLSLGARTGRRILRVDLHPADFDHPSHVLALERVLRTHARRRASVTYDELAAAA